MIDGTETASRKFIKTNLRLVKHGNKLVFGNSPNCDHRSVESDWCLITDDLLGVMTVLSISTVGSGHRIDLPRVSYSTALDIYIVVCFGFVFLALVEYAIINLAYMIYIRKSVSHYLLV